MGNEEEMLLSSSGLTGSSDGNSCRGLSRKNRVYVFREFLRQTYFCNKPSTLTSQPKNHSPHCPYIKRGDVVLDVAGGKGDLSWLLLNVDGLESVIADPRSTSTPTNRATGYLQQPNQHHLDKSLKFLRNNPDLARERAIPGLITFQPLAALLDLIPETTRVPRQAPIFIDEAFVEAVRKFLQTRCMTTWTIFWDEAWKEAGRRVNNDENERCESNVDHNHENSLIMDGEDAMMNVILKLRLIVGFHPDQATEAILDLADLLQIPFAVVPCCVFPREFPHRCNPDGTRVRTHAQFLQYLRKKVPTHVTLYEAVLPFPFTETAKNIVLFTLPQLFNKEEPSK